MLQACGQYLTLATSCSQSDLQYRDRRHSGGTRCLQQVSICRNTNSCKYTLGLTWYDDITVVSDQIFKNLVRAVLDVHVAPVNPAVLGLQGSAQQEVPGLAHSLSARTLCLETVSFLDAHSNRLLVREILLDNHNAAEWHFVVSALDTLEFHRQDSQSIVIAVSDKETEVDQVVRVGQLADEFEVLVEVVAGVAEGSEDEDTLLVEDGLGCGRDFVEVDMLNSRAVDLYGRMVVEDDGCLLVACPSRLLRSGHLHGRF